MLNDNITEKRPPPSPATASDTLEAAVSQAGELIPIDPIAPPDVYSGIFLKIAPVNKNLHLDSLSFGGKTNSTMGNPYLCLSTKPNFDENDSSKQWIFEQSEMKGYYVLRNRKLPYGYVTWEDDDEQVLVIETRREFQRMYRKGGPLRKNVLFKVIKEHVPTKNITDLKKDKLKKNASIYDIVAHKMRPQNNTSGTTVTYKMAVLGMDEEDTHIILDSVWAESTGCYLLRRTFRDTSYDGDKMEHLFKIARTNQALKVVGLIEEFKFKEQIDELYKRAYDEKTTKPLTSRHVFNHNPYPMIVSIEDAHERRDRFHLKFRDNSTIGVFNEMWVTPGLDIGATMSRNDTEKASMVKLSPSGRDTVEKFKYHITGTLQVPASSSMIYTVMFGWLEDLVLQFDATLKIVGKGDRMTVAEHPKVIPDQLLTMDYVYEVLKLKGFKIDHKPQDPKLMWHKMAIRGALIAKTMGIKGDVEMTIKPLTKNISTTCHHPQQ